MRGKCRAGRARLGVLRSPAPPLQHTPPPPPLKPLRPLQSLLACTCTALPNRAQQLTASSAAREQEKSSASELAARGRDGARERGGHTCAPRTQTGEAVSRLRGLGLVCSALASSAGQNRTQSCRGDA